jgi:hypothetical protein
MTVLSTSSDKLQAGNASNGVHHTTIYLPDLNMAIQSFNKYCYGVYNGERMGTVVQHCC